MSDHDHGPDHGHERGHSHATMDRDLTTHREAVVAIWVSVAGLGATAAVQLVIVGISGSAALFADALHNVGDVAGTATLLLGLRLARRPASDRFPWGWGRAEDLAGLAILVAIAASAALALWDSFDALVGEGHRVRAPGWAFAAAIVGAIGNEAVAIYKIRVGRRIDSVALVADGQHARVDGLVSLGAAAGIAGSALLHQVLDPVAGLGIAAVIVAILLRTGREVLVRNLDGVAVDTLDRIREVAADVPGVLELHEVRARHAGRRLFVSLHVDVDADLPLHAAHDIAEEVRHTIVHELPAVTAVDVHLDPHGHDGAHERTAHHFG